MAPERLELDVPIDVGDGPTVVILHGFGLRPATDRPLADLLARRCRVIVPDLFGLRGRWRYQQVGDAFAAALDRLGVDRATLVGHSFGGAIELGFAARSPQRVTELVFSDTLAVSRTWSLSVEVLRHPAGILRLATRSASAAFLRTWAVHPRQLFDAGWWAFRSDRDSDSETVAGAGIPAHVLWANRDSILDRSDGIRFAEGLHATFTVACGADGEPIDHDWMFQEPTLFFAHLEGLGLVALS